MSRVEEALRAAMRARDGEAPTAAGFRFRLPVTSPTRSRFRWVPAVAAAACVAIVIGIVVVLGPDHQRPDGVAPPTVAAAPVLDCPSSAPTEPSSTDYPLPTPRADGLDVADRLVPTTTPVHAVVCAYLHPDSARLSGTRVLANGLAVIPGTLAWLPPGSTRAQPCPTTIGPTDTDFYLVGLSYPTGTMWVAAPGNHCVGSSNGRFETRTHVATYASAAYRTGRWTPPAPPLMNGCPVSPGRLGQERILVPGTPVSVLVCQNIPAASVPPNFVNASRTGAPADLTALVAGLNALPAEPDSYMSHCGLTDTVGPAPSYRLVFSYRVGPPVDVTIAQDCLPAVHNGSLQATDASSLLPIVHQVLTR